MSGGPAGQVVIVVDDDAGARDALSSLLRASGFAVEVYDTGAAFLAAYQAERPQCILLDLMMPGMDGFDVHKELLARGCPSPVVFVTAYGNVGRAVQAMKAGAFDFIEKPFQPEAVIGCVKRAFAGPADHAVQAVELRRRIEELTPRERDVLDGIVDGLTNAGIAERLGISPRTVEIYRAQMMKKMQARNLSELIRLTTGLNRN